MIPQEITDIVNYLSNYKIKLPTQGTDSRSDSAAAENHIVSLLLNGRREHGQNDIFSPNMGQSTNRAWYDVKIKDYYCDIKVSELRTNDNTNAKKAIYYFLTGDDTGGVSDTESRFFKQMKENETPNEYRDYYYIIVNKLNTSDVFVVSLKGIAQLSAASNNPPFQCRWNECRSVKERDWSEAKDFLLGVWAESITRKIENAKKGMPDYYPHFFKNL